MGFVFSAVGGGMIWAVSRISAVISRLRFAATRMKDATNLAWFAPKGASFAQNGSWFMANRTPDGTTRTPFIATRIRFATTGMAFMTNRERFMTRIMPFWAETTQFGVKFATFRFFAAIQHNQALAGRWICNIQNQTPFQAPAGAEYAAPAGLVNGVGEGGYKDFTPDGAVKWRGENG